MTLTGLTALAACICLICLGPGCGAPGPLTAPPDAAIRALLAAQAEAWNRGDLDGFMSGYERSARVSFSGSSGTRRGWDAILARYRQRYPDRAAMGRLAFSNLEVTQLNQGHALVLGEYRVERDGGALGGFFSLILERSAAGWRILHDHTSASAPAG